MSVTGRPPGAGRYYLLRPLLPNLVWEGVLLVVLVVVAVAARAVEPRVFDDPSWWTVVAMNGLLAVAVALSLRMGTPNLAVPALAASAGAWFVSRVDGGMSTALATIVVVLLCLVIGLVAAAFVAVTGAPAWAVTLALLAILQAVLLKTLDGTRPLRGDLLAGSDGTVWFLLFAILSIGGGVLLAVPAVRAGFGADGPLAGPLRQRFVAAAIGLGVSSAVAGLAGVLLVRRIGAAQPGVNTTWLLIALGIALLGGVGATGFGWTGGVFGVLFATLLVTIMFQWIAIAGGGAWLQVLVAGLAILVGLLVGLILSVVGRRVVT